MQNLYNEILENMLDYIADDAEADYSAKDVDECGALLAAYMSNVKSGVSNDTAMEQVKLLVLSLNTLNEKCEYSIIETDQREGICALIFQTLSAAGVEFEGDVTEEWREW